MFEFAWPWIFALLPLPWRMRLILPVADSGEPALKVSFLGDLEGLARRRARINLIRHILKTLDYEGKDKKAIGEIDDKIVGSGLGFVK